MQLFAGLIAILGVLLADTGRPAASAAKAPAEGLAAHQRFQSENYRPIGVEQTLSESTDRILDRLVSIDVEAVNVRGVLEQLSRQVDCQFHVNPKLFDFIDDDPLAKKVTIRLTQLPLRSTLRLVLQEASLAFEVRDEAIWIVSNDFEFDWFYSQPDVRVYPVADLVAARTSKGTTFADAELVEAILQAHSPDTWMENGGMGAISYFAPAMSLVVRQSDGVHSEFQAILSSLREAKEKAERVSRLVGPDRFDDSLVAGLRREIFDDNLEVDIDRAMPAANREVAAVQVLLTQPTSIDVERRPLIETLNFLERESGAHYLLDPAAVKAGLLHPQSSVSLRMNDASLRSVLNCIARPYKATTTWNEYGLVVLRLEPDEEETAPLFDRQYTVTDLVTVGDNSKWTIDCDGLWETMQECIAPDSWFDAGGVGTVYFMDKRQGAMDIRHSQWVHQQLEWFFPALVQARERSRQLAADAGWKNYDVLAAAQYFAPTEPAVAKSPAKDNKSGPAIPEEWTAPIDRTQWAALLKDLKRPVTATFTNEPIENVLRSLSRQLDVNVTIDAYSLEVVKEGGVENITASVRETPLEQALESMFKPIGLEATFRHNALVLSEKDDLAEYSTVLRVYPVADLIAVRPARFNPESLIGKLMALDEDTWMDNGGVGAIYYYPPAYALVVAQTYKVHRKVEERLRQYRQKPRPETGKKRTA